VAVLKLFLPVVDMIFPTKRAVKTNPLKIKSFIDFARVFDKFRVPLFGIRNENAFAQSEFGSAPVAHH
jgi:hypothetical protein